MVETGCMQLREYLDLVTANQLCSEVISDDKLRE